MIYTAANELRKGFESNFLVFDDAEQLRGVLQDDDILDALKHKQFDALISTYTTVNYHITRPFETLKEAYNRMLQTGQYMLPVMDGEALIGVLDMAMIQNYIKLKSRMS
jgi:predicted transcriptional regulator